MEKVKVTKREAITAVSELLTIKQMAARLQVKPSWLYFRTMQTGANSIPRLKIGKYLRFEPGKVMQWIETNYGGNNGKS